MLANVPQNIEIHLDHNPWHCNCHLQQFQKSIVEYPSIFPDLLQCSWPRALNGAFIQTAEICTAPVTDPSEILGKCNKYAKPAMKAYIDIALQRRNKVIRLRRISSKVIEIQLAEFPTDHILVWYENGVPKPELQCWLNRDAKRTKNIPMRLDALAPNKVHTFCMKPKHSVGANLSIRSVTSSTHRPRGCRCIYVRRQLPCSLLHAFSVYFLA